MKYKILIITLSILGISDSAYSSSKKTIGELLSQVQNADRGAKLSSGNKESTAVPKVRFDSESNKNGRVDLESVRPSKAREIMKPENSDQREYIKILDRQINELYTLTRRYKESKERGELWLRLAELYVEKASMLSSQEQDVYDRRLKEFKQGQRKSKPTYDLTQSRDYNKKAVQLYEWFQRDFQKDPKIDQALFFLGFNYFELGDPDKGADYYNRLIHKFPKSPYVQESEFALAEYYFDKDRWADAYKKYSPIIKNKNHRLHIMSVYKGAWCLYRLNRYKEALHYLETLIRQSKNDSGDDRNAKKQYNKNRLEQEAQRDLILFYASAGDPDKAAEYFSDLLGGDTTPYIERLAYHYSDKGDKEPARTIFKNLIADKPKSPKAFDYQYQIVQNYFYIKNTEKFKEELYDLIKGYGPNSSWYEANSKNSELIKNSQKLREAVLRNYTLQNHQTAQNSRASFSQNLAHEGYQLYFQEFSNSEKIADMHFYYGELLYDMQKYDESGIQYKWVVDNAPNSKFADKAGANLIHAIERSIPSDKEMSAKTGDSLDKIPLEPRIERFIKVGEWYISKFPNGSKTAEIQFRIGRLYYQSNHFEEAHAKFKLVVNKYPRTKYAEYSANLMLDIYNLKKDYAGLEKTGSELLAVQAIAESKAGSDIRGVMEKASFKKAQDLESQKKYEESAILYEKFVKQNPKSELAQSAQFNAGINYERAGKNTKAIAVYHLIMSSTESSARTHKQKVRKILAKLYQDSGDFEKASKEYRIIADENPKDPLLSNYLFNAAVLSDILGNEDVAIKNYDGFIEKSRKYQDRLGAHFAVAEIERKRDRSKSAIDRYQKYIEGGGSDPEKIIQSYYWIAELYKKRGKTNDAEEWRAKTISAQRRLSSKTQGVGAEYAARFKLMAAKTIFNEFKSIKLPANPAKQKAAFEKKVEWLARLTSHLNEVVKLDSGEEIVSAMTLIGLANRDLAQAITSAPIPGGLSPEEQKAYKEGIFKQFAEPALEKSREAFRKAVNKGSELDSYNEDYLQARAFMSEENSKEYYENGETSIPVRLINWVVP